MLDGVMLILVTMFAVLGAYYLSEVLAEALLRDKDARAVAVVAAGDDPAKLWSSVLDVRVRLPRSTVIVVSDRPELCTLEPGLQDVLFTAPDALGAAVCAALAQQEPHAEP